MSFSSRRELLCRVAARYQMGDRKERTAILDEFTATRGYARKYAIRQLNQVKNGPRLPVQRNQRRWYGVDVEEALLVLWKAANFICAKRLIPFFPELIPVIERHGYLSLSQETREKLLSISPATADRILKKARRTLPFQLLGLDTDNGSEFLNEGLVEYCKREKITFTRGRPYKKNDQCYVEQKNGVKI